MPLKKPVAGSDAPRPLKIAQDEQRYTPTPRREALLVPSPDIFDEPTRCIKVNVEWYSHISGMIDTLSSPELWQGDTDGKIRALQQIASLLAYNECVEPMDCGDVQDCMEDIIDEINVDIINIEQGGNSGGNPANLDKDPTTGVNYGLGNEAAYTPTTCGDSDKNKLWGAIDAFVDFVHSTNLDLFQAIASYTNKANLLSTSISAIPLIGLLPVDEGISFASQLADTIAIEYNSNVTTVGLYDVKCELFCQAVGVGCGFTVNDALGYFVANDGLVALSASSSFQDYSTAFLSALTLSGMEWFCLISALQLSLASLGETFVAPYGMKAYTRAAQAGALSPSAGWQAWCSACASHTGAWTIVLDFANDYVAVGSELVFRNAFGLLHQVSGVAATLTNAYGRGIIFTNAGSQSVVKQINVAGGSVIDIQANVRKVSGTASSVGILNTSNTYTGQPRRNFSSSAFAWTTAVPLFNVAGTAGAISYIRIDLNTTLASQTCVAEIRYLRITGTGAIPQFT